MGGAGVTGSGGLSHADVGGAGTLRPKARPAALSRGDGSAQQRLLKSSKSIAQAVTPPKPCRSAHSTYFIFKTTIYNNSIALNVLSDDKIISGA